MTYTTIGFNVKKQPAQPVHPNNKTIMAMLEAEHLARNPQLKHFTDIEEALKELKR